MKKDISRRSFLKIMGAGTAAALAACAGKNTNHSDGDSATEPPIGQMTYRTNPKTGEKVSLLGYGMMRLPEKDGGDYDQEMINRQVDYAMEHGLNYFDTSPAYCRGLSERCTGIALSRHPRESYFVATKLSNFDPATYSREASIEMYHNSMKELQVDYIDYYLLHAIGGGGMKNLHDRYLDNGILDFLLEEREAGRIHNLGFSYHGDIEVFDYLLAKHDKYKWDFVQIELNWLDWNYANEINDGNTDASYLYAELQKRGIPAVIMEPLLGGRLAKVPQYVVSELKQRDPQKSVASWAFRYSGTPEGVLTVLSGMTYMEHLKDNLVSYCPLVPLTEEEINFLDHELAHQMMEEEHIPCNDCKYCMPCPYGINIPAAFVHYNRCKIEGRLPTVLDGSAIESDSDRATYRRNRRQYLISLDRAIPRDQQPDHCIQCGKCVPHCPQKINIPQELERISQLIDELKRHSDIL